MKCHVCHSADHITRDHACVVCKRENSFSHTYLGCPDCDRCKNYTLPYNSQVECGLCGINHLECDICYDFHPTKEHICVVCQKTGVDSHDQTTCPERCSVCSSQSHRTNEHKCVVCQKTGADSHASSSCPKHWTEILKDVISSTNF